MNGRRGYSARITAMDTMGTRDGEPYRRALSRRGVLRARLLAVMDSLGVDLLAYPTSRRRPVLVGEAQPGGTCGLSAHSGLPALSAPAGFTNDGMPVGIEFLGRPLADVALVGMDNTPLSEITWPTLTTVDLGSAERARIAAELLLERIAGSEAEPRVVGVEPTLVVRASSGAHG